MIKYIPWGLALITLTACSSPKTTTSTTTTDESTTSYPCIAGFVEDAPGVGTLDFFFPSEFTEDIQSVSEVSVKVAEEITKSIGVC